MSELSDSNQPKQSIEQVLMDWDGADLMEGVQRLAKHYPSTSLKQWLELTAIAEHYRQHHKTNILNKEKS